MAKKVKSTLIKTVLIAGLTAMAGFAGGFILRAYVPAAMLGGTDFGMDIDQGISKEEAFILKGTIDYPKKDKDGMTTILIRKDGKTGSFEDDFIPVEIPVEELEKLAPKIKK